jgi:hypothetical protein
MNVLMEHAYVQFGLRNPVYYRLMFMQRGDFLTRLSAGQQQPHSEALRILRRSCAKMFNIFALALWKEELCPNIS